MKRAVGALALLLLASLLQAVTVRGTVVDPVGGLIVGASVRLQAAENGLGILPAFSDRTGNFELRVAVGRNLDISVPGFRPRTLRLEVPDTPVLNLGTVVLQVGGCDTPGTICDDFGLGDPLLLPLHDQETEVYLLVADQTLDFRLRKGSAGQVWMEAAPGATISGLGPDDRCDAKNLKEVRIDGPDPKFCVMTSDWKRGRLYLLAEVPPNSFAAKVRLVIKR